MTAHDLRLLRPLRQAIRHGHPWLYRSAVAPAPALPAGAVVRIVDRDGFVAWGVWDPEHPIAVRIWSLDAAAPPAAALVERRIERALRLRRALIGPDVEAWRLLHGEADGTPGWALDVYGDVWVVRTDGPAAVARLALLAAVVADRAADWNVRALVHRRSRGNLAGPRAEVLLGSLPEGPWSLRELHWQMEVDVVEGQKTGWFLDQRENRRRVFELARGRRVANLFSYTGGFSLAAALGGAAAVASVDISAPAMAAARRNFVLNGLDPDDYTFAAVDAFDWLAAEATSGRTWDLIIVDPPSFAPNARSVPAALKAYRRLLQGAASLIAADGLVAAASCSSHIDFPDLEGVFAAGVAAAGRSLQILERRGPGVDHPELPAFPEGRYLKFVLGRVDHADAVAAFVDSR